MCRMIVFCMYTKERKKKKEKIMKHWSTDLSATVINQWIPTRAAQSPLSPLKLPSPRSPHLTHQQVCDSQNFCHYHINHVLTWECFPPVFVQSTHSDSCISTWGYRFTKYKTSRPSRNTRLLGEMLPSSWYPHRRGRQQTDIVGYWMIWINGLLPKSSLPPQPSLPSSLYKTYLDHRQSQSAVTKIWFYWGNYPEREKADKETACMVTPWSSSYP